MNKVLLPSPQPYHISNFWQGYRFPLIKSLNQTRFNVPFKFHNKKNSSHKTKTDKMFLSEDEKLKKINGCELFTVKHVYENNFNTVEDRFFITPTLYACTQIYRVSLLLCPILYCFSIWIGHNIMETWNVRRLNWISQHPVSIAYKFHLKGIRRILNFGFPWEGHHGEDVLSQS